MKAILMSINKKKYFHHTVSHTFNQHIVIESISELPLGVCHVQNNTHLYTLQIVNVR